MADAQAASGRPDDAPGTPQAGAGDTGVGKKATAKKATAKKTTASKATPKKATPKKATAKKATAKKATPKKATAKKATAKKATAKKATAKKATPAPASTPQEAKAPPAPPLLPTPDRSFPPSVETVERPWLDAYPPLVPPTYPYPEVALTRLLDDAAKDFPESIATEFSGRTLTYRRLLDQVDRFATALQALGIGKGDRVGLALPNCPQHVIAFYGVLRAGAIVVQHDPTSDEDVLNYEIDTAGCRALVISDPVYAKVAVLKGRVPTLEHVIATPVSEYLPPVTARLFALRHRNDASKVFAIPAEEGVLRFTDLIRRHPPAAAQVPVDPAVDVALLAFEPETRERRAVMLTHANLLANVFQIRLWIPDMQAGRETVLCAVPFWHPYGLVAGANLAVLSAAVMSLVPDADVAAAMPAIAKRKPTIFAATSAMVEAMVTAQLRKVDLASLRAVLTTGAGLSAQTAKAFEDATGSRVREAFGPVHAAGLTHANPVYGRTKPGQVGLPLTDTVSAVVDADGQVATHDRGGELIIHGPQVMPGFWNRPEDTARILVDGWLRTGMAAEIDGEGYVTVLGPVTAA